MSSPDEDGSDTRGRSEARTEKSSSEASFEESLPYSYRTRRAHRKSKAGCAVCKKRRVKCDETKPSCDRCRVHGVRCVYMRPDGTKDDSAFEIKRKWPAPSQDAFSMALTRTTENIGDLLRSASASEVISKYPPAGYSSLNRENLQAVARFELFTCHTMGSPLTRQVIRNKVLPLAFHSPHLMHAVIAASKTHLHRLAPAHKPQQLSDTYHWERAISLYQKALDSADPDDQLAVDALISTRNMLTIHSFACGDSPNGSWLYSSGFSQSNWLLVHRAFDQVLEISKKNIDKSIWGPVIKDTNGLMRTLSDQSPGPRGIPSQFIELCEVDETSTPKSNPYHGPLRDLSAILGMDASGTVFLKLITFIKKIEGEYWELLKKKDPRALLILAYWIAHMCKLDMWWVQDRMRNECQAICFYLEKQGDPRIIRLLEFPALSCGYYKFSQLMIGGSSC